MKNLNPRIVLPEKIMNVYKYVKCNILTINIFLQYYIFGSVFHMKKGNVRHPPNMLFLAHNSQLGQRLMYFFQKLCYFEPWPLSLSQNNTNMCE